MRQCPSCNAELADDAQICPNCGRNLAETTAAKDLSPPTPEGDGKQQSSGDVAALPLLGALAGEVQGPAAHVPTVEGTPQASGVPTVQGTPITPHEGGVPAHQATTAHTAGGPQPLHASTTLPRPSSPRPQVRLRTRSRVARGWLIGGAGILVVIAAILIGLILLSLPTLSLNGSSSVSPGSALHLHGSGFLPGGNVTFTLDHHRQLPIAWSAPTQETFSSGAGTTLQILAVEVDGTGYLSPDRQMPMSTNEAVQVGLDGSFDVTIVVDNSWSPGQHTITATESPFLSASRSAAVELVVTGSQVVSQPPPSPTPPPPPTPTPIPTIVVTPSPPSLPPSAPPTGGSQPPPSGLTQGGSPPPPVTVKKGGSPPTTNVPQGGSPPGSTNGGTPPPPPPGSGNGGSPPQVKCPSGSALSSSNCSAPCAGSHCSVPSCQGYNCQPPCVGKNCLRPPCEEECPPPPCVGLRCPPPTPSPTPSPTPDPSKGWSSARCTRLHCPPPCKSDCVSSRGRGDDARLRGEGQNVVRPKTLVQRGGKSSLRASLSGSMVAIVLGILLAMAIAILNRLFSSGVIATGKRNRRYK